MANYTHSYQIFIDSKPAGTITVPHDYDEWNLRKTLIDQGYAPSFIDKSFSLMINKKIKTINIFPAKKKGKATS